MMMTAEKNIWEQGEVASGNYHFRAQLIFLENLGMSETTKRSNIHNSSLFAAEIYLGSVFSVSLLFTGLHHKLFSLPGTVRFWMCILQWHASIPQWMLIADSPKASLIFYSCFSCSSFLECKCAVHFLCWDNMLQDLSTWGLSSGVGWQIFFCMCYCWV